MVVEITEEGKFPKNRTFDQVPKFDPTLQYCDFIEIVPPGMLSVHCGRFVRCDWNYENIKTVQDKLAAEWKEFVPEQFHDHVKIIIHKPIGSGCFFNSTGTVAWKTIPVKLPKPLMPLPKGD